MTAVGGGRWAGNGGRLGVTVALLAVGLVGLGAWWWMDLATTLPLAAAMLLAVRWCGWRLGWWAALPAGVVASLVLVGALLAVTGAVGLALTPTTALLVQAAPLVTFAVLDLRAGRAVGTGTGRAAGTGTGQRREQVGHRAAGVAAVGSGPALFVAAVVVSRARSAVGPVIWTMGWDARNHLILARDAIADGGLSPALMGQYPALANAVCGAVAMTPGRSGLAAGALLGHDLAAVAWVWGLGIVLTGVLSGLVGLRVARTLRPAGRALAAAVGSLSSISGVTLGVGLELGFLTATWGMVLLSCLLLLGFALWSTRPGALAVLAAAVGLLCAAVWTLLAGAALAIAAAAAVRAVVLHRTRGRVLVLATGLAVATLAVMAYLATMLPAGLGASSGVLIAPTYLRILVILVLVALVGAGTVRAGDGAATWTLLAFGAGTAAGLGWLLLGGASLQDYYPQKLVWMAATVLLPVAGVAFLWTAEQWSQRMPKLPRFARGPWPATAAAALVGVLAIGAVSVLPSPVVPWWSDPTQSSLPPRASVPAARGAIPAPAAALVLALRPADSRVIVIGIWGPRLDRWVNHWISALHGDSLAVDSPSENPSQLGRICAFTRTHPGYRVVTLEPRIPARLRSCRVTVQLDPPGLHRK